MAMEPKVCVCTASFVLLMRLQSAHVFRAQVKAHAHGRRSREYRLLLKF